MSREIKFRAWHKPYTEKGVGRMDYELELIEGGISAQIEYAGRNWIELLQFTGLKDKNGKEIYEGDVVEYYVPQAGMNHKQRYIHDIKWNDKRTGYDTQWIYGWEVIGNIYENPELLNEEKQ